MQENCDIYYSWRISIIENCKRSHVQFVGSIVASTRHLEKNRKREDHLKSEPCKKRELELEWGRAAPLGRFHLADLSSIHHTPKTILRSGKWQVRFNSGFLLKASLHNSTFVGAGSREGLEK